VKCIAIDCCTNVTTVALNVPHRGCFLCHVCAQQRSKQAGMFLFRISIPVYYFWTYFTEYAEQKLREVRRKFCLKCELLWQQVDKDIADFKIKKKTLQYTNSVIEMRYASPSLVHRWPYSSDNSECVCRKIAWRVTWKWTNKSIHWTNEFNVLLTVHHSEVIK
jgi:hypothetical protein